MEVKYGEGKTKFGSGVDILLSGEEVARAIESYLMAHNIHIYGPRTFKVNNELCVSGSVYVDPSGQVYKDGKRFSGSYSPYSIEPPKEPKEKLLARLKKMEQKIIHLKNLIGDEGCSQTTS